MPKVPLKGVRPLGLALAVYDVYRRLPPEQRRQLVDLTRKHGPRLAQKAMKAGADARRRRTGRK